jgi:hypothetical protein
MLPGNIAKEMAREYERNERGRKDRKEENRERGAKRRRETLEQQPQRLEQGILRCPRRAGLGAGGGAARARVPTAVCRGHCRANPTPCSQVPRQRRRAHGAAARPREHLADSQPLLQDHQEVPLQVPDGA